MVDGLCVFSPMESVRIGGVGGTIARWLLLASCDAMCTAASALDALVAFWLCGCM